MAFNSVHTETKVDDSFLSAYTIASVEYPQDHENGQCIIHFDSEHADLQMRVNLIDGWRDGEGLILREDGTPFIVVHFTNGVLDGKVTEYDDMNNVVLRGYVCQGEETGLFVEFDRNGMEVWSGYYLHGKRHTELKRSIEMDGFYEERDGSGALKSVIHFDLTRLCKDGVSYEFKDGKVSQICEYRNGTLDHVVMEMKDDVLIEYDDSGKKMYEGGFSGEMKTGFKREGKGKEYDSTGKNAVYVGEWENGKRNGYGVEYKDYKAVYSGNWKNGKRVRSKSGKKKLPVVGEKASKWKTWQVILWIVLGIVLIGIVIGVASALKTMLESNEQATFNSCNDLVSFPMEKVEKMKRLVFKRGFECEGFVDLSRFVNCEAIKIESEALTSVKGIGISRMTGLKEMIVGDGSCSSLSEVDVKESRFDQLNSIQIGSNAMNELTMVPFTAFNNLTAIVIGSSSLNRLSLLTLASAVSLQSLTIGSSSLQKLNRFRISDYLNLQLLRIGSNSLTSVKELKLSGLWNLGRLEIGEGGLSGVERVVLEDANRGVLSAFGLNSCFSDNCLTIGKSLVLKNMKQLEVGENCYPNVDLVTIDGVEGLESLVIGAQSFNGTEIAESALQVTDCSSLKWIELGSGSFLNCKRLELKELKSLESFSFDSSSLVELERMELVNITLRRLMIGSNEFGEVRELIMRGMSELESVVIGENSFKWTDDGIYRLENCPKLQSIAIGDGSFASYQSFELESLPSIRTIEIGEGCFGRAREWVLSGLDRLVSVEVGSSCFRVSGNERKDGLLRIQNCGRLESIEIGDESFEDYGSIELNNLDNLDSLVFGMNCFKYAPSLSLNGMNELRAIHFGASSFAETESLVIGNNSLTTMNEMVIGSGSLSGIRSLTIGSNSLNSISSLPISSFSDLITLSIGSSSLYSLEQLSISNLPSLQSISIQSMALVSVLELELSGMNRLSRLTIGANSLSFVETLRLGTMNLGVLTAFGFASSSTALQLSNPTLLPNVKTIEVMSNSFPNVNKLVISGVEGLERIVIGNESVNGTSLNSEFRIENCTSLRSIAVGSNSFRSIRTFVLRGLPNISTLQLNSGSFYETRTISINDLSLNRLAIGDNRFVRVRELVVNGLSELESIAIGSNSFRLSGNESTDGLLRITNCHKLESIVLGDGSFGDYKQVELDNLRRLQSVSFGANCFKYASSLLLNELTGLRTLLFGASSFFHITALPSTVLQRLHSLSIGSTSLSQLQSFSLNSMTSLQSLMIGSNTLTHLRSLDLSSLSTLNSISIGSGSFSGVESLRMGNNSIQVLRAFGLSDCSSGNCFTLSGQSILGNVKRIEILSNTFTSFTSFNVFGASKLQCLTIGSSSFSGNSYSTSEFRIANCSSLRSLTIGSDSFLHYSSVVVTETTNLRSLSLGNSVFQNVIHMEMKTLGLESITLENDQFPKLESFILSGLNRLMDIHVGKGNGVVACENGLFSISNCHVVSSIVIGNGSFRNYTEMTISNNLALVSIELGESGFSQVHTVTFSSPSVSGLSHRLDFSPKHSSR